jgi:hypothetical protein
MHFDGYRFVNTHRNYSEKLRRNYLKIMSFLYKIFNAAESPILPFCIDAVNLCLLQSRLVSRRLKGSYVFPLNPQPAR